MTAPAGAVVTGAGVGLGRQIACLLAERGHRVLVTDIDEEAAAETAAIIGDRATPMVLDVGDPDQVAAAADRIVEVAGRLDVWVNNAGILLTGPAWEQDSGQRRTMLTVNALGTVEGTVSAINAMRVTGGGHIINIASLAGLTAVPGEAVYAASKHAVMGFSVSTAADLRAAGIDDIHLSCICPDGIWSPMLHDKLDDPASALSFSGRLLHIREVVEVVASVLDAPRPVTSIPRWRGLQSRLAAASPRTARALLPLVVAHGRRRQRRFAENGVPD